MNINDKEQIILAFIVVFVLFCIFMIFGIIYKGTTGRYSVSSSFSDGSGVYLENVLPVSDALGKAFTGSNTDKNIQGYKEFYIENIYNKSINYEIYLVINNKCDDIIDDRYIKLYLTDYNNKSYKGFDNNLLPTYSSLSVLSDYSSGRLLYKDKISAKSKSNFRLRVWVSDLYPINKSRECFSFDVKVRSV